LDSFAHFTSDVSDENSLKNRLTRLFFQHTLKALQGVLCSCSNNTMPGLLLVSTKARSKATFVGLNYTSKLSHTIHNLVHRYNTRYKTAVYIFTHCLPFKSLNPYHQPQNTFLNSDMWFQYTYGTI